jgi:LCP family protein required for cell wall assembly
MINLTRQFYVKAAVVWLLIMLIGTGIFFGYQNKEKLLSKLNPQTTKDNSQIDENTGIEEATLEDMLADIPEPDPAGMPILDEKAALAKDKEPKNPSDTSSNFNILILGIDRRHGNQTNWRTDVIQLVTLSADRKKAVLTHIPRDVWADNYKINAVYNLKGPDAMKDQVEKITGQRPDRVIRVDFDAFVWAVDSVGGLTINVPVGFTDANYPRDREGKEELTTIEFEEGMQTMDGETALMYVRSRKGNNGQGSDYARGTRQQIVMEEIIDDYFKTGNVFTPKNAETLYKIATEKVYTDISLNDMPVLYQLLTNYKQFEMNELSLDTSNYLQVPADSSLYGGSWTLVGKNDTYEPIHQQIENLLGNEGIIQPL